MFLKLIFFFFFKLNLKQSFFYNKITKKINFNLLLLNIIFEHFASKINADISVYRFYKITTKQLLCFSKTNQSISIFCDLN